jgi:hypothetical protein
MIIVRFSDRIFVTRDCQMDLHRWLSSHLSKSTAANTAVAVSGYANTSAPMTKNSGDWFTRNSQQIWRVAVVRPSKRTLILRAGSSPKRFAVTPHANQRIG